MVSRSPEQTGSVFLSFRQSDPKKQSRHIMIVKKTAHYE